MIPSIFKSLVLFMTLSFFPLTLVALECSLAEAAEDNPKITLTGEIHSILGINHETPEAKAGVESFTKLLIQAEKKEIVLALEGAAYQVPGSLDPLIESRETGLDLKAPGISIHGLEEESIHIWMSLGVRLSRVIGLTRQFLSEPGANPFLMLVEHGLIMNSLSQTPLLQRAFQSLLDRPIGGGTASPALRTGLPLARYYVLEKPELFNSEAARWIRQTPFVFSDLLSVYVEVFKELSSIVETSELNTKVPLPEDLLTLSSQAFSRGDLNPFFCLATLGYRNLIFQERLEKIYCEAKTLKRDLVVRTGGLHLQGLEKLLHQSFEGRVGIEVQSYSNWSDPYVQWCQASADAMKLLPW